MSTSTPIHCELTQYMYTRIVETHINFRQVIRYMEFIYGDGFLYYLDRICLLYVCTYVPYYKRNRYIIIATKYVFKFVQVYSNI